VTSERERLVAIVRGLVQGVGFRWFVVRRATGLGLVGWVANEPDGSVRVLAEGDPRALAQLEAELRRGPNGARVTSLDASRSAAGGGLSRFEVRASGHRGD
jgi:acylphosphatase